MIYLVNGNRTGTAINHLNLVHVHRFVGLNPDKHRTPTSGHHTFVGKVFTLQHQCKCTLKLLYRLLNQLRECELLCLVMNYDNDN